MIKKPVLVHVPKTAGGSIWRSCPWIETAGHRTYRESIEEFGKDRFYFSVVRHPVDRFVSCMALVYKHINSKDDHKYCEVIIGLFHSDFRLFLINIIYNLPYFDFNIGNAAPIQKVLFRSQYEQLQDIPVVIFYERLQIGMLGIYLHLNPIDNIDDVADLILSGKTDLKHLNKTEIEKPSLSNETINLIEDYYHDDMVRYGYNSKVKGEI